MRFRIFPLLLYFVVFAPALTAQQSYSLDSGWRCMRADSVNATGEKISNTAFSSSAWMPATVPGTVLTSLLDNKRVPDPYFGMNNQLIPDIYITGNAAYTYWFIRDFAETKPAADGLVWLELRGINYGADIFLNGHKLNATTEKGMFRRLNYNITSYLISKGINRLAVIVYPPDPAGNPNRGQGGDGEIARNVTHQYVAGWDWIQPVPDRNTGIWDKVTISKSKTLLLRNPHVVTKVEGVRMPDDSLQAPAIVDVSVEVENPGVSVVRGIIQFAIGKQLVKKTVSIPASTTTVIHLPRTILTHPKLWWPAGYGEQFLYQVPLLFFGADQRLLSEIPLSFGIREVNSTWDEHTRSARISVNGQKIFIKGGNWIISDELLRFSPARFDAEVRFHRDMNLNLIRVWGGALTERPEFYEACDKYGMLVWQDLWGSGDCNGRWEDPKKKEDQWTRRQYPDDHALFISSAADQIRMLRNHPSLALWCGGNEITPPEDLLLALKDSLLPGLDGTRPFFDFSNSDSLSYNTLGGNGDGPYGLQDIRTFFGEKTFPFNSEVGSVGVGDYTSLQRFLPPANLALFPKGKEVDSVWEYHKYIGYDESVNAYGIPANTKDFAFKAQLVNYDQYRGLAEGFTSHMWEWYTGFVIWKTQNPWTALRGQMYDYYLDPNACLYGLRTGSESLHVFFNAADSMIMIANNGFRTPRDLMLQVNLVDMNGKSTHITDVFNEIGPQSVRKYLSVARALSRHAAREGAFLSCRLLNRNKEIVSDNLYWLADSSGRYSGLQKIGKVQPKITAVPGPGATIKVTLVNPAGGPVAFFSRLSAVNPSTHERLLPVFYSDNYVSVLPGEEKIIMIDYAAAKSTTKPVISVEGWNVAEQFITAQ